MATYILGIDPGLQKTGWGIIGVNGNALRYIDSGLIKTDSRQDLCKRLAALHFGLIAVVDQYKPQLCAIEETFVNKNPHSTLKLGQARGVLMAAAAIKGLTVGEYSANKVKKSVVGSGHAAKQQMDMMVKTLLPSCGPISEDEADALAVAITHAHYSSIEILNRKDSA
ncbi:MAG: crossover junction endodeoxyribonuclease RuvC [Alphaproteobacteria bacterium]|nr:crossover junction endodeoxyribonuclease RuvC [Alphaproteobacteria bacterium]